jgi:uncharacterized protein (TIGR02996 family)
MRTFQYSDAKSHKFWTIEVSGDSFTVTYGKVGAKGQTQTKSFPSPEKAQQAADKLIAEKLGKGYRETTPAASGPGPLRTALEAALAEDPDDLAAHMAYADFLHEQGDPRGEFIQTQLALEDDKLNQAQREALQKKEADLLAAHGPDWFGEDLARALFTQGRNPFTRGLANALREGEVRFVRGWVEALAVDHLTEEVAELLRGHPSLRLLRSLSIDSSDWDGEPLATLARSPVFRHLRLLCLGTDTTRSRGNDDGTEVLVAQFPSLEELDVMNGFSENEALFALPTLSRLRSLAVYHSRDYPLDVLADNPALGQLRELKLWPHALNPDDDEAYIRLDGVRALVRSPHLKNLTRLEISLSDMGDPGCQEIVASGVLKRLRVLKLGPGRITDEGARTLAGCPDLKHLDSLDLDRNCLTEAGIAALAATGVNFSAKDQWQPGGQEEFGDIDYLMEGDWE